MIYWIFLLFMISSSAQAIQMPSPCVAAPVAGYFPGGVKYFQVKDGSTTWRIGPGASAWTIHQVVTGKTTRMSWTYGAGHWRILNPTNCQVVNLLNQVRDKIARRDYSGMTIQTPTIP